jgi:hypothetical protein
MGATKRNVTTLKTPHVMTRGVIFSAKDWGREGDGEQRVRWSKVVDGKGGKKEGLFEWVIDVEAGEELTIETE